MTVLQPLVDPGPELSPGELRRYSRHLLLEEVGPVGQRRLRNARVLVVGAGGLGSPVLQYLAAAGVGRLGIIDFDVVEESNLHRQVIHGEADLGRPKVDSAREAVARVNPLVRVETYPERLTADNVLDLVGRHDLVVDGTDNFPTRYLVNDACALLGKPYVWASILRFDGQVSVFWAGQGPCYRCVFPEPPPAGSVPSCAEGGVLGVLPGSIGAAQAAEAIKLIVGAGDLLVGRIAVHNSLRAQWREIGVRPNPACPLCGENPTITTVREISMGEPPIDPAHELTPGELEQWLAERAAGQRDFVLVDVREEAERLVSSINGSMHLPTGTFDDGTALEHLPDKPVVLHCQGGIRSARVLRTLLDRGVDARHLSGGILAWESRPR